MKYSITINQKQLLELEPTIGLEEAVLLDVIYSLCSSVSQKISQQRLEKDSKIYTWINYDHLLEELPLLKGRTKATITPLVKKLIEWELIECFYGARYRKYFRMTEKGESAFRNLNTDTPETSVKKTKRQRLENLTNPITIYPSTINPSNTLLRNASSKITQEFQDRALRIIETLAVPENKRSALFKVVKDSPPGKVQTALEFARDYEGEMPPYMAFFWRLNKEPTPHG